MIVCFEGIDGSGKSMQAMRLVERLNAAGYPTVYVWNGGKSFLTGPLIRLVQRRLRAPKKQEVAQAHPEEMTRRYRSYLSSTQRIFRRRSVRTLWLHISLLEHTLETWALILPHLLRGRIVVCDRYIYDTAVAVAVLSGQNPEQFEAMLRQSKWYFVPRITKWLFLDLPPDVAYKRKNDVYDLMFLERRVPLYRTLARMFSIQTIDGTRVPDDIAAVIWESVTSKLPKKAGTVLDQR